MDEQLALRLGALRLARRRGRLREAAWAAARLRLAGVSLGVGEARFARDTRIRFGRALRSARIRMTRPAIAASVAAPVLTEEAPRADRRRLIAAVIAAAMLMAALFFFVRLAEPEGAPEGVKPSTQAVVVTPPPLLKGRSQPGAAAPVAIVEQTAAPEAPPTITAPGTGTGAAGGGTGAGGSGNGTGVGNGRGTPAPTPRPTSAPSTPTPTATPDPIPDPLLYMHLTGWVKNGAGVPLAGVCLAYGTFTCPGGTVTDANGNYSVYVPAGSLWSFKYIDAGYKTYQVLIASRPGPVTQNVFLAKSP